MTIIGTNSPSNASNELNQPQGMFYRSATNTLYIVDTGNDRILRLTLNNSSSTTVSTVLDKVSSMYAVYVDDDDVTMYVARRFENRVEKWLTGASTGERIGGQCKQCRDVRVDREKNVYMTESGAHTVMKWSPKTNTSIRIAGQTDELGHTVDRLYFPTSFYLTSKDDLLYIVDTMNNRIVKWNINSSEGVTVAGAENSLSGNDASLLANPQYAWIDENSDIIYVADTENNRVQRFLPNHSAGTTIVGGTGKLFVYKTFSYLFTLGAGNANNQLKRPTALAFDNLGNLYVCDSKNHRIQMFTLIDNQTCIINRSHSLFIKLVTLYKQF